MSDIMPLVLPYKRILTLASRRETVTLGEYVVSHACSWVYRNLKEPFRKAVSNHEFLVHPSQRYSPFMIALKQACLELPVDLDDQELSTCNFMQQELEEVASLDAMLQALYGYSDASEYGIIKGQSDSPSIGRFQTLIHQFSSRVSGQQMLKILHDLYFLSFSVWESKAQAFDKNNVAPVPPSRVIETLVKKIQARTPEDASPKALQTLYLEFLEEQGWGFVEPMFMQPTTSLFWALASQRGRPEISRIALRNFFETVFLVPVNDCFVVDVDSPITQRAGFAEHVAQVELESNFDPSSESCVDRLGTFVYTLTQRLKLLAHRARSDPFGEERFVLHDLPDVAAAYLCGLVQDYRSRDPKFFPKQAWDTLADLSCPVTGGRMSEFIHGYDQKVFERSLRDQIVDALYCPEDCINLVERRARECYSELGDLRNELLGSTVQSRLSHRKRLS